MKIDRIIIEVVCQMFNVRAGQVFGESRISNIVDARSAYIFACYNTFTPEKRRYMNGLELAEHMGVTANAIYHHVHKCEKHYSETLFGASIEEMCERVNAKYEEYGKIGFLLQRPYKG